MVDGDKPRERNDAAIAAVPVGPLAQLRRIVTMPIQWRHTIAAFRHRNYRLFFVGQFVSLIGTWMQSVAQNWLVYQICEQQHRGSAALSLGFINFLGAIPITLLTLPAGVLADRYNKRNILIGTQTAAMLLAFILSALVFFNVAQIWHVAVLSLLLGTVNAIDIPARQSFVVDMVGRDDLMNAIALNSSLFNGARVFGPALAGVLIGLIGMAGCFFLNGLSFLAVIFSYTVMHLPILAPVRDDRSVWHATREALRYVAANRIIRAVMTLVAITSLFGWSYSVLLPVFAGDRLHIGAKGYGYLLAANGAGAFIGAITLAALGNYPNRRRLVYGGLTGFCVMIALFALSNNPWLSAAALAGTGFFMIIFFATANTSVQLRTPDELRGRVMGIYAWAFLGINPFGSILTGWVAHATSAPLAIWMGAGICAIAALVISRLVPRQATDSTLPPQK